MEQLTKVSGPHVYRDLVLKNKNGRIDGMTMYKNSIRQFLTWAIKARVETKIMLTTTDIQTLWKVVKGLNEWERRRRWEWNNLNRTEVSTSPGRDPKR